MIWIFRFHIGKMRCVLIFKAARSIEIPHPFVSIFNINTKSFSDERQQKLKTHYIRIERTLKLIQPNVCDALAALHFTLPHLRYNNNYCTNDQSQKTKCEARIQLNSKLEFQINVQPNIISNLRHSGVISISHGVIIKCTMQIDTVWTRTINIVDISWGFVVCILIY